MNQLREVAVKEAFRSGWHYKRLSSGAVKVWTGKLVKPTSTKRASKCSATRAKK